MKTIKIGLLLSATALLSACASTGEFTPAPLTLKSDNVYTFDDSKSFALNVAEMTNKTSGLRDVKAPEDAQHRISGAETGLALFAGGMSSGIFGLAGMGAIYSGANDARNWKPMYVFTDIDAEHADDLDLTRQVENLIDEKLRQAFASELLDGNNYVGLSYTVRKRANNYNVYISGKECNDSLALTSNTTGLPTSFGERGVFGAIDFTEPTCNIPVTVSIEQIANVDGQSKLVVVMEQIGYYKLVSALAQSLDGYGVIPERYLDLDGTRYSHSMPFVAFEGHVHVFSQDIEPIPFGTKG